MTTRQPKVQCALLLLLLTITTAFSAYADSFTINGPGVRVQERRGWFGRRSQSYDDALGNSVGYRQGIFHRSDHAGVFGNQAKVTQGPFGSSVSVHGADGKPMVESERHWYGANNTTIDGTNILRSIQSVFQQSNRPPATAAPPAP
jgi:hypothetical protein